MNQQPQTLLAFDFGEKRIGVAVGQTITKTCNPLVTVKAKDHVPDWQTISQLIDHWQPDALVVGLPLNMDGTEQDITGRAQRFARQLNGRYGLPVHTSDERLTTREAYERLLDEAASGEPDPIAAQVILEGWFQSQQANS